MLRRRRKTNITSEEEDECHVRGGRRMSRQRTKTNARSLLRRQLHSACRTQTVFVVNFHRWKINQLTLPKKEEEVGAWRSRHGSPGRPETEERNSLWVRARSEMTRSWSWTIRPIALRQQRRHLSPVGRDFLITVSCCSHSTDGSLLIRDGGMAGGGGGGGGMVGLVMRRRLVSASLFSANEPVVPDMSK